MTKETLSKADLAQFTGTEVWYNHSLIGNVLYTDGIRYVAEKAGAYWLIDEIAFGQGIPHIGSEEFQLWKLKVDLEKSTAVLTCDNGNGKIVFRTVIPYTDFPLDEIKIYFTDNVILLPSEY
ncbi:MAG: hypothetical protein DI539_18670 [Flavobacterium psychrophilum]|nr:MAG: hypothetical protein DI539_18670 [Flavobacterium psychrophilum]